MGYLPQRFGVHARITGSEFVEYMAWRREVPRAEIARSASRALDAVGLGADGDRSLGSYSGGMLRRVGIAQAIVHDPSVLLLDEPTAGLDPVQRVGLREVIRVLPAQTTVVVATHATEDLPALPGRVLVLDGGALRLDAATDEFLALAGAEVGPHMSVAEAAYLAALRPSATA